MTKSPLLRGLFFGAPSGRTRPEAVGPFTPPLSWFKGAVRDSGKERRRLEDAQPMYPQSQFPPHHSMNHKLQVPLGLKIQRFCQDYLATVGQVNPEVSGIRLKVRIDVTAKGQLAVHHTVAMPPPPPQILPASSPRALQILLCFAHHTYACNPHPQKFLGVLVPQLILRPHSGPAQDGSCWVTHWAE